jgi:hypothetical protein
MYSILTLIKLQTLLQKKDSDDGCDPEFFHGNLGAPGYQLDAPPSVSNHQAPVLCFPGAKVLIRPLFPLSVWNINRGNGGAVDRKL